MKKFEALHRTLLLTDYIKLESCKIKQHHPLKNDMNKSSRRIMFQLNKNGPMNQRTMSKILSVSPQAISESVKKLEINNLIEKEIFKNETLIKLTPQGIIKAEQFTEHFERHANELFEDFTDEELETFIRLSEKIMKKENENV